MSELQVITLAPRTPASSPRKRHVTPSPESSSNKRIVIVGHGSSLQPLSEFHRRSFVASLPSHAHPHISQAVRQGARKILLPFDLSTNPRAWEEEKNSKLLADLFPGHGVGFDGLSLVYWLNELPPKPWPKIIAGVPCYFSLDINSNGMIPPMVPAHWSNPRIRGDVNGRELQDWDQVFDIVRIYFENAQIPITEVQYWRTCVFIVLEHRDVDAAKLPNQVANLRCYYLYEDEMGRPLVPQACRIVEPSPGNPDESQYDPLRPGIRFASGYSSTSEQDSYFRTSAGLIVRDAMGNTYVTAASHGFPVECGNKVYHPAPMAAEVGELIMELTYTDVALVKLHPKTPFSNETFQNDLHPESIMLRQFARPVGMFGGVVMMDSPDSGYIDGTLQRSARTRIPADDPREPEQHWIRTTWFYTGQGSAGDLPDGTCGSAIYDENGSVYGFFRYAPNTGVMTDWCAGISAEELINRGFTVA